MGNENVIKDMLKIVTDALEHYTMHGSYTEEEGEMLYAVTSLLIQNEESVQTMLEMLNPLVSPYLRAAFKKM